MHKIVNLLLLSLFLSVHLVAQNTESNEASTLFAEGKYSAAQTLYQQIITNNAFDENAHYHNARCSKELFASDAIFLYEKFLLSFSFLLLQFPSQQLLKRYQPEQMPVPLTNYP